jgi:hypothetical protein
MEEGIATAWPQFDATERSPSNKNALPSNTVSVGQVGINFSPW